MSFEASIKPGMKIGRWTVLDEYDISSKGVSAWLCRCECGTQRFVAEQLLKDGESESCRYQRAE